MTDQYTKLDQQIVEDAADISYAHDVFYHLCDAIGPRFAGTPGYRAAAEYVRDRFDSYGLKNARLESFGFTAFRREEPTVLRVTSPISIDCPCYELVYGGPTGQDGICGELINLGDGTPERFVEAGDRISGRVVLITDRGRHRREVFEDCVTHGAVGFVYGNPGPGMLLCSGSIGDGEPCEIPTVGVPREVALRLARLTSNDPVEVQLGTNSRCEADTTWNVVGDLPGQEQPDELIFVGGHLDSHEIGPGAYDNAAGAVVVIEAARLLGKHARHLKRTVRFINFAAEEIGLLGSIAYAEAHEDELAHGRVMFNVDMPGLNSPWVIPTHRGKAYERFIPELAEAMGESILYRQATHHHSDHYPFCLRGLAALGLAGARADGFIGGFGHTAADTPEKVPTQGLAKAASFLARMVLRAANEKHWPKADEHYD